MHAYFLIVNKIGWGNLNHSQASLKYIYQEICHSLFFLSVILSRTLFRCPEQHWLATLTEYHTDSAPLGIEFVHSDSLVEGYI